MGNHFSNMDNDLSTQQQIVSFALNNAINEIDLLLGLHSAAKNKLHNLSDIYDEIDFYTQKVSRIKANTVNLTSKKTDVDKLNFNIFCQLQSVYLSCAESLTLICEHILKNANRTNLYDHLCSNQQIQNALLIISEAKIRCILIRGYLPSRVYNYLFDSSDDVNLVTAKFINIWQLPTETFLKPLIRILCQEILYEKQLEFVFNETEKSLFIDLANLSPDKSNSCLAFNRTMHNISELNVVSIKNIDFSLLQRDVIFEICETLKQVEIVKKLVVHSVNINGKVDDVSAIFAYLSRISTVKLLELTNEAKAAYTAQVEHEFNNQQMAYKISDSALSEMRLQIMNVARPYEPQFSYKQVLQSIHDATGKMFRSQNFLYNMSFRVRRLHPATIHALYLRSVVLNNDICESIFKPNLESNWEQVTVKCDDQGVIGFHTRARAVIDAAVLTRYGATYLDNHPVSTQNRELQVIKRCTRAPRHTLILYRQKLDELKHDWGYTSLTRLEYFDAIRSVTSIFAANNVKVDVVAKNVLSFLCKEPEQRKFEYQPLRKLFDEEKYTDDGSDISGCKIF